MSKIITDEDKNVLKELISVRDDVASFEAEYKEKLDNITEKSPLGARHAKMLFYKFLQTINRTIKEAEEHRPNASLLRPILLRAYDEACDVKDAVALAELSNYRPIEIFRDLSNLNRQQANNIFEHQATYPFEVEEGEDKEKLDKAYMFGYMRAVSEVGEFLSKIQNYIDFEV